ncbi:MAG: ABC transporter substrate-binding protein [Mesorhizobium sp.]
MLRITLAAAAVLFAVQGATAEENIVIGLSTPLTGSVAALGQHENWGASLAAKEINEAGGINGKQIQVEAQDNQCNPTQGITSVENLLEKNPIAVIGALCSSVTLAVMPVMERAERPLMVGVATSPIITEQAGVGGNQWTFRINPSDAGLAVALGKYLADKGSIKTIAFVGEDTDYGRGGHSAMAEALKGTGIEVVSADFYKQGTPDFTTVLTRIKAAKPDAVALYATGVDELGFIRQYRGMNIGSLLSGRVSLDELLPVIQAGALEDASSVYPYAVELNTPENKAFVEKFEATYGELPNNQSFQGYESIRVLADALKRSKELTPAALRNALKETDMTSVTGGTIKFDDHNQAHNLALIMKVKDGVIVIETTSGT